jgi:hypothetical protein
LTIGVAPENSLGGRYIVRKSTISFVAAVGAQTTQYARPWRQTVFS